MRSLITPIPGISAAMAPAVPGMPVYDQAPRTPVDGVRERPSLNASSVMGGTLLSDCDGIRRPETGHESVARRTCPKHAIFSLQRMGAGRRVSIHANPLRRPKLPRNDTSICRAAVLTDYVCSISQSSIELPANTFLTAPGQIHPHPDQRGAASLLCALWVRPSGCATERDFHVQATDTREIGRAALARTGSSIAATPLCMSASTRALRARVHPLTRRVLASTTLGLSAPASTPTSAPSERPACAQEAHNVRRMGMPRRAAVQPGGGTACIPTGPPHAQRASTNGLPPHAKRALTDSPPPHAKRASQPLHNPPSPAPSPPASARQRAQCPRRAAQQPGEGYALQGAPPTECDFAFSRDHTLCACPPHRCAAQLVASTTDRPTSPARPLPACAGAASASGPEDRAACAPERCAAARMGMPRLPACPPLWRVLAQPACAQERCAASRMGVRPRSAPPVLLYGGNGVFMGWRAARQLGGGSGCRQDTFFPHEACLSLPSSTPRPAWLCPLGCERIPEGCEVPRRAAQQPVVGMPLHGVHGVKPASPTPPSACEACIQKLVPHTSCIPSPRQTRSPHDPHRAHRFDAVP